MSTVGRSRGGCMCLAAKIERNQTGFASSAGNARAMRGSRLKNWRCAWEAFSAFVSFPTPGKIRSKPISSKIL
jgi:hypothetical protein